MAKKRRKTKRQLREERQKKLRKRKRKRIDDCVRSTKVLLFFGNVFQKEKNYGIINMTIRIGSE
jgi:hypothetical protein